MYISIYIHTDMYSTAARHTLRGRWSQLLRFHEIDLDIDGRLLCTGGLELKRSITDFKVHVKTICVLDGRVAYIARSAVPSPDPTATFFRRSSRVRHHFRQHVAEHTTTKGCWRRHFKCQFEVIALV